MGISNMKDSDLEILNCKECKDYLRLISQANRIKKVFYQISAVKNRIDDRIRKTEDDFYDHIENHFPEEKEKEK